MVLLKILKSGESSIVFIPGDESSTMGKNILPDSNQDFEKLLHYIQQKQIQVFQKVNTALIDLYWELGKVLSEKVKNNEWGKSVVTEFAKYITSNVPDIKGFSDKNLWRMKQFYETYVDHPELSALLREISWTHNTIIFSRCKSTEERICEKCIIKVPVVISF